MRQLKIVALGALLAVLTGACGDVHRVTTAPPTTTTSTTTSSTTSTSSSTSTTTMSTTTTSTTIARPAPTPIPTPPAVAAPAGDIWACVANAETGGDYGMHGSTYSSAFGILNAGIREQATSPAEAARIIAGTATPAEELEVAQAEQRRYGWQAWALATRRKCGLP